MDASPGTTARDTGRVILVTGATGKQGGAALRQLRARGFPVRALTRDAQASAARALAATGVEVVEGDLDDRASLDRALAGAYGVYAMTTPSGTGIANEVRQGTALADAAKAARVGHFLYSSVGGADRRTGIPHFESKFQVEEHIRAIGLPQTILRPVFFMENWGRSRDAILSGTLVQPLGPATPLQMVAVDDIGAFAALAFSQPERWLGDAVELAGDALTMPQAADTFARVGGRPVRYSRLPLDQTRRTMGEENAMMFTWFNDAGYAADIPALRALYPQLTTLEQWLRRNGWGEGAGRPPA